MDKCAILTKGRTERRLQEMRDHQRESEIEERRQMRLEEIREHQREVRESCERYSLYRDCLL